MKQYRVRIWNKGRVDWVHCESEAAARMVAESVANQQQCECTVWWGSPRGLRSDFTEPKAVYYGAYFQGERLL